MSNDSKITKLDDDKIFGYMRSELKKKKEAERKSYLADLAESTNLNLQQIANVNSKIALFSSMALAKEQEKFLKDREQSPNLPSVDRENLINLNLWQRSITQSTDIAVNIINKTETQSEEAKKIEIIGGLTSDELITTKAIDDK